MPPRIHTSEVFTREINEDSPIKVVIDTMNTLSMPVVLDTPGALLMSHLASGGRVGICTSNISQGDRVVCSFNVIGMRYSA